MVIAHDEVGRCLESSRDYFICFYTMASSSIRHQAIRNKLHFSVGVLLSAQQYPSSLDFIYD